MMVAHNGSAGTGHHAWLAHLDPYLSVSKPVGPGRDNRRVDVMWVQYLMLRIARDGNVNEGQVDHWRNVFLASERKAGTRFLIDGKFGTRTGELIVSYQAMGLKMSLDGRGGTHGTRYVEMKGDGCVHPAPDRGRAIPITDDGRLYTIAHMNERFRVLHLSYQNYVLSDEDAPFELKCEVQRLLPRSEERLSPVMAAPSYHIARSRHLGR